MTSFSALFRQMFVQKRRYAHLAHLVLLVQTFAYELAQKAKVGVTPGRYFGKGGEGYVRLSYASSTEQLQESLRRITDFVNNL